MRKRGFSRKDFDAEFPNHDLDVDYGYYYYGLIYGWSVNNNKVTWKYKDVLGVHHAAHSREDIKRIMHHDFKTNILPILLSQGMDNNRTHYLGLPPPNP